METSVSESHGKEIDNCQKILERKIYLPDEVFPLLTLDTRAISRIFEPKEHTQSAISTSYRGKKLTSRQACGDPDEEIMEQSG